MKHTIYAGLLLIALVAFTGCKDEPTGPDNSGKGSSADSFYPLSKGSSWTYTGSQNYTLTVTGDTTVNGTTWTIFRNSNSQLDGYIRKAGTAYISADTIGGQEYVTVKEEAVGTTWSFQRLGPNFTLNKQEFSIVATGLTKTVKNKEYTNVMHVHLATYVFNTLANEWVQATTSEMYFAKGVGFIYGDYGFLGTVSLESYTIK